jgi:hypothetical protein
MKLLTKTNTYYLVFLLSLLPIMILLDHFLVRHFVYSGVNATLLNEKDRILDQLEAGKNCRSPVILWKLHHWRRG